MSDFLKKIKKKSLFLCLFGLLITASAYGIFDYRPLLDDFIQYKIYAANANPFTEVILRIGLLSSRPLAGIFDIYFWSHFFNNFWLARVLILCFYFASAYLLLKVFFKHFGTGIFFFVIFLFAPFVSEGVYWLSAASRTVVSVFFTAVALTLLMRYLSYALKRDLVGFLIFNLLSYCFYEQTIVLSFVLTMFVLARAKSLDASRTIPLIGAFVNGGIVGCFYLFVRTGENLSAGRMSIARINELWANTEGVLDQIRFVFLEVVPKIILYGFRDGLSILLKFPNIIFLVLIIGLLAALFFLLKAGKDRGGVAGEILLGAALFVLTFLPFFLLKDQMITLRTLLVPMVGLSLLIDGVIRLALPIANLRKALCVLVLFVFVVAGISENYCYSQTAIYDETLLQNLDEVLPTYPAEKKIALIGAEPYYRGLSFVAYYEHIYSVMSSQWALTGALRAHTDGRILSPVYPLWAGESVYEGYDDFGGYSAFWSYSGYDEKPQELFMRQKGDDLLFFKEDGSHFATAVYTEAGYLMTVNS